MTGLVVRGSHLRLSADMPGTWPDPLPDAVRRNSSQCPDACSASRSDGGHPYDRDARKRPERADLLERARDALRARPTLERAGDEDVRLQHAQHVVSHALSSLRDRELQKATDAQRHRCRRARCRQTRGRPERRGGCCLRAAHWACRPLRLRLHMPAQCEAGDGTEKDSAKLAQGFRGALPADDTCRPTTRESRGGNGRGSAEKHESREGLI